MQPDVDTSHGHKSSAGLPENFLRCFFWILRGGLAAVFLSAGLIKSSSTEPFMVALMPFTILPNTWIGPFAFFLPWVEIAAALMTVLWPKRIGAAVILFLCLAFCGALAWALANHIIVDCGCFGTDETPSAAKMGLALGRDAALSLAAAALVSEPWLRRKSRQLF